ncbi:MAG: methionyl-tRNA formyltransferase [bacterium (Candidatus Stahlbacteria) CG08_land_8_20_14_0_20_40_26]|nr:MAG: methionyl-tRNA formyltransferase [bacterium (Candidatus Stahlbacteria) CG23_combo_of_CG06-09_8_20_14_all_40_9]PIS25567.1 MAG: methionyl-tRNA formyltransferase [bacterium (Candidatus Stahlbacteria) CG08_land_8_20_14_0_20_40_26]
MKVVFFGTGGFATYPLVCLTSCHNAALVITSCGKIESPVASCCRELGIPLLAVANPNEDNTAKIIRKQSPDILVVIDYGYILKDIILSIPRSGSINLHPSLLPKYRGASPIQRTIMNGEKETGVTTFFLSRYMDRGDIIMKQPAVVGRNESYGELKIRLTRIGAGLLLKSIALVEKGFKGIPQEGDATYAPKIKKEERKINWNESAEKIKNLILALSPTPGAYTTFRGKRLIILRGRALPGRGKRPGEIINNDGLLVSTADGILQILELRPEGRVTMSAYSFKLGYKPRQDEIMGG